jgi:glycosyltransferase 2 family protein
MIKKLIAGLLLSTILVYLSIRGIDFGKVIEGFHAVRYGYVLLFILLVLTQQTLRSVRWGMMLSPLEKVDQISLFSVTSVGFLAIIAVPARLGELARPYLITKKSRIRMTAALGTILVERAFDSITVLFIFGAVLFFVPVLPPWLMNSALIVLLITLTLFMLMTFMLAKREASLKVFSQLINRVPERFAGKLNATVHHLIDGFNIFRDVKLLVKVTLFSFLIWMIGVLAIYSLFVAFAFQLPLTAATVLQIILLIGIAIPAAPGFIGNWHYACILGLTLFGIPKADALTFAILYHFLSIAIVIVLGLIFLPFNKFSLSAMKKEALTNP